MKPKTGCDLCPKAPQTKSLRVGSSLCQNGQTQNDQTKPNQARDREPVEEDAFKRALRIFDRVARIRVKPRFRGLPSLFPKPRWLTATRPNPASINALNQAARSRKSLTQTGRGA
jgi:hypothetical protein